WRTMFQGIAHVLAQPPNKGEFYLTDAFQYMIDRGARIRVEEVEGWYDCGQIETLIETNRYLLENGRGLKPKGGKRVRVTWPVRVEEGVTLDNVEIGPNVTIEAGSVVRGAKLVDSVVGRETLVEGARLHGSVIGAHVKVRRVDGSISVADHSELLGDEPTA
ncbi:MAG: hypothetical protein ACRELX_10990, partial [Longimicrobiales bacterium]